MGPFVRTWIRETKVVNAKCVCMLLASVCVIPSAAQAAGWQRDLSISSTAEYDSNPGLEVTDRESVWRARLVPGVALTRIDGADEVRADARMRIERSTDSSRSSDRNDPSVSLGWRHATER